MIPALTLPQIIALVIVTIGTITDLKSRKIPNVLTFPAAAIAIVLHFFLSGFSGALLAVGGWFTGALIMACPILLLPQKGGFGDIKLMGAIGALLGPKLTLCVFFYFCIFYGVLGMGRIAFALPWHKLLMQVILPKQFTVTAEDFGRFYRVRKSYMPLGPAILLGTICALIYEQQTLAHFGLQ